MATLESYVQSDAARLALCVRTIIQERGLVSLPTETFYGLGVNPFDAQAVDRLLRVKGRDDRKPVLVLIGDRGQLPLLAAEIPPMAELLMETFWPGALTILFPALPVLPHGLTAKTGVVGIRLSAWVPLTNLLQVVGPVTGTSANRTGRPPARTAEQVQKEFGADVDLIVDTGETPGGLASTVVDPREPVRLIREGAISRQMIQNVLQTKGLSLM